MTAIMSPTEVEGITGAIVTQASIDANTSVVGIVLNRDLTDAVWVSSLIANDASLLRQAVAWQTSSPESVVSTNTAVTGGGSGGIDIPANVKSLGLGDISLTMRDVATTKTSTTVSVLSNLAMLALSRLSWRRSTRNTLSAAPFDPYEWWMYQDLARTTQSLSDDGNDSEWAPIK